MLQKYFLLFVILYRNSVIVGEKKKIMFNNFCCVFPACPGVTKIRPDELEFPSTMTDIDHDSWMLSGSSVMQVSDAHFLSAAVSIHNLFH